MPPHEPLNGQPSQTPEAYDFIRQYGGRPSKTPLTNMPPVTRIAVVVVGGVLLLAVIFGFIQLLAKPSDPARTIFIGIAQQQNEIARVAKEAGLDATEQPTLNFAVTTQYSISSDQTSLLTLLTASGGVPSQQVLAATQSSATDTQLTNAKTNGTYDQTYLAIAQAQLTAYQQILKQAFTTATNVKEKQWVQKAYQNAQLLTAMSSQTE